MVELYKFYLIHLTKTSYLREFCLESYDKEGEELVVPLIDALELYQGNSLLVGVAKDRFKVVEERGQLIYNPKTHDLIIGSDTSLYPTRKVSPNEHLLIIVDTDKVPINLEDI